jgi:quercetin dioxygenase-like cupin family protein
MQHSLDGLVICPLTEGTAVPGRRASAGYFDLGLAAATDGRSSAHYQTSVGPIDPPTGWHYHDVESQMIYMIKGWVDLAFEDGTVRRIAEGSFARIPGGMIHNEIDKSHESAGIEIVIGTMKTVACAPPAGVSLDTLRRIG